MGTYPPMTDDRRDSQQISTFLPAENPAIVMHTDFSSNPTLRESPSNNFAHSQQFLIRSTAPVNSSCFEPLSLSLAPRGEKVINPVVVQFHDDPSILGCNNIASGEMGRMDMGSKYLKAAQELLEEVVSVKKDSIFNAKNVTTVENCNNNCESNDANLSSLSPGEKQEMQDRLTKLLWMLDEVGRRYREYYHQMRAVVSSFDSVSGSGSAKPYTWLALRTISRHFRALRDAINGQIGRARKSLGGGGGDCSPCSNDRGGIGISRLRHVDRHIGQQRALQQLGMVHPHHQHAWRPQRGLPEASVTILRAWLFEHFLHPYPKDSDKVMLARQTGLTRSQVSNWFINARVRLWKPMIEEMYREEEANKGIVNDAEADSNSSTDNTVPSATATTNATTTAADKANSSLSSKMNPPRTIEAIDDPLLQDSNYAGPTQCGYYAEQQDEAVGIFPGAVLLQANDGDRRFFGGISLTLGLQHERGGFVGGGDINNNAYIASSLGYGGS